MHGATTFFVAFLTSVITAAGTVYVIERYDVLPKKAAPAPPEAVVPSLQGLSEADARANATTAHLALLVASREPTADAKPGSVIRQSIPAGQRVPQQHPVSVVLAEEVPKVPTVTGLTEAEATQRAQQRGFALKVSGSVPSPTVAQGNVVEQSPAPDAQAAKGATIVVQLSSGPGDVEVPKLVGVHVNKAQEDLQKLGLKPVVRWIELAETQCYVVLSQKPAAKEKLKPGGEVQLTVCR